MTAALMRGALSTLIPLCVGCSSFLPHSNADVTTIEHLLTDTAFQKENLPVRTLRVVILADAHLSEEVVRNAFSEASRDLLMQVGVAIAIVGWHTEPLPNKDSSVVFKRLRKLCSRFPEHDIAIGITLEKDTKDEEWRGNTRIIGRANHLFSSIHLRALGRHVIIHEIGHLLLGPFVGHSLVGVMHEQATTPFFTVRDRLRILKRKWNNFGSCAPSPSQEHQGAL